MKPHATTTFQELIKKFAKQKPQKNQTMNTDTQPKTTNKNGQTDNKPYGSRPDRPDPENSKNYEHKTLKNQRPNPIQH